MSTLTLDSSLASVVGGRTATPLEKAFGMHTARDLLWHFPRRYSNRGDLTPLTGLPIGEHVTVLAQVLDVQERRMERRKGSLTQVRITDGTGTLLLTFFNQPWMRERLLPGMRGLFAGKVSEYRGQLQLQHPDMNMFDADEVPLLEATGLDEAAARAWAEKPEPIYPATAKVASWVVARAVAQTLDALDVRHSLVDPIPSHVLEDAGVIPLGEALELIHRPLVAQHWRAARDSMRFREAFHLQLSLLDRRRRAGEAPTTARLPKRGGLRDRFDAALPFELTQGQREASVTIAAELARPHPMHRLLQGEVGSGKTIVALRAMLQVAEDGGQSAMLAPTEVLAAQHFRSVTEALGPELMASVRPVLLTSKMPAAERRRSLLAIASGSSRVIVGTHALISANVTFYDLGLIVVDEQHRFGVDQREALRLKGAEPHVLAMTATPIPRTVALTVFGDLETTTMRDLPPGRQGIESFVVPFHERPAWAERAWVRATEEIAKGRQVYVVCPAIAAGAAEEGEPPLEAEEGDAGRSTGVKAPLASVEQTLSELSNRPDYAGVRVAALTGAMKTDEKDCVMRAYAAGEIDVLVATTVIEVGVNVPNASMMIVRDAERFGVSQLHQLRGRVGRGEHPGLCLLLTNAAEGTIARERIEAVASTTDGFELAEVDLHLRREGDILGTAQSGGAATLKLLRVAEHGAVIEEARRLAADVLERDPHLEQSPALAAQLAREAEIRLFENLAKS